MPQPVGGVTDEVEVRGAISRVPGLVRHGVEIDAHRGAFTLARVEQAAGPVAVADVVVRRTRVPGQARGLAADGHAVRVDQVALEGFAERADAEDAGEGEARLDVSADAGALGVGFGGCGGILLEQSLRLGGLGRHRRVRVMRVKRGLQCVFFHPRLE